MTGNAPAAEHSARATAMRQGRQADSTRRRQRVLAALNRAATDGTEISAASIARAAGVDRSFLYRHRDLLAQIHALEATPPPAGTGQGPGVTRASLHADLLAAGERAVRLTSRIPATGDPPVRDARRAGLARVRARRPRRPRRPQPEDQQPRAAEHRPAPATRRTRSGPRGRTRRQPRAHGPTQHPGATPVTPGGSFLHHTCRARYDSSISL